MTVHQLRVWELGMEVPGLSFFCQPFSYSVTVPLEYFTDDFTSRWFLNHKSWRGAYNFQSKSGCVERVWPHKRV